jgi:hypothetical protein
MRSGIFWVVSWVVFWVVFWVVLVCSFTSLLGNVELGTTFLQLSVNYQ